MENLFKFPFKKHKSKHQEPNHSDFDKTTSTGESAIQKKHINIKSL